MNNDITPDLIERIQADFKRKIKKSSKLKSLIQKVGNGSATYKEAQEYAIEISELMSEALLENISSDMLPDGRLYYNIAERVLQNVLGTNGTYKYITEYCDGVQQILNQNDKVGIKPITPKINQDRIKGIVNIVSGKTVFDDIKYMFGEPIVNYGQSIVDESVRSNAGFQYKAGMSPKIIRTSTGKCCEWCDRIAGTYDYSEIKSGSNVWRRHKHCQCLIEYSPGNGKRQDTYTKRWRDETEIQRRKNLDTGRTYKYNNTPATKLKEIYTQSVKDGWISALSGFDNYYKLYNEIQDSIVGKKAVNGLEIKSQSKHFMDRVIGTSIDPKIYNEDHKKVHRDGVSLKDIKDALFNGKTRTVRETPKGKSQSFTGSNCRVSINPDTGTLIQCNPKGR